jgi:hypothetical protein
MLPQFVTFTGVDDRTDVAALQALSARYPIEWGVLFGGSIGLNRYPSIDTVFKLMDTAGLRLSAHFCGSYARAALDDSKSFKAFVESDDGEPLSSPFSRFQINSGRYDMDAVQTFHRRVEKPVIIQVRGKTFPELTWEGVTFLHDTSGGKGRQPKLRPVQPPGMALVGHAGGIGPENVREVNDSLDAHTYYLDMETGVRTNDWFDLDKCETVCRTLWG